MTETHSKPEIDQITGVETTGHEWDGIKELNNPLPRWWLIVFYACVVWSVGYWIVMPAWPLVSSYTTGVINHSDRANVKQAMANLASDRSEFVTRLTSAESLDVIEQDADLQQFALAAGRSAFGDNCATCHGSGGQGAIGYPNLNDDVWLWGGKLEDIQHTLRVGIRSTHEDTRFTQMPSYGRDNLLTREQIGDLVEYVVHLSGRAADAAAVDRAAPIFEQQCASCHGPDGRGDQSQGAPNLTDQEWLYGGDRSTIQYTIYYARNGVMPTWAGRLDDATINALAVYVHALGGGE